MRIIAGERRGRPLRGPRKRGVRPTGAYLREAVFNVLAPRIPGAHVLDLFAGTGAIGLEALSRGARAATFVDHDVVSLRDNLSRLDFGGKAIVIRGDALRTVGRLAGTAAQRFDLIYADPPYGASLAARTVAAVADAGLLVPGGLLLVEHHHKVLLPEAAGTLARRRELRHGETIVTFYGDMPA